LLRPLRTGIGRFCCKSLSWTSDGQMLSIHLKWDFLRRRPEECDSSKNGNQNKDSICGSTPNVKGGCWTTFTTKSAQSCLLLRCSNSDSSLRV